MASSHRVNFDDLPEPEFAHFKLLFRAWTRTLGRDVNALWESSFDVASRHKDLLYDDDPLRIARQAVKLVQALWTKANWPPSS